MTYTMTADRVRAAERAAGAYDDDGITGLVIATTTVLVPGTTTDECDAVFTERFGREALDLVVETVFANGHCTYVLEDGIDYDEPRTEQEVVDDFTYADRFTPAFLPVLNREWTLTVAGETILTITH